MKMVLDENMTDTLSLLSVVFCLPNIKCSVVLTLTAMHYFLPHYGELNCFYIFKLIIWLSLQTTITSSFVIQKFKRESVICLVASIRHGQQLRWTNYIR